MVCMEKKAKDLPISHDQGTIISRLCKSIISYFWIVIRTLFQNVKLLIEVAVKKWQKGDYWENDVRDKWSDDLGEGLPDPKKSLECQTGRCGGTTVAIKQHADWLTSNLWQPRAHFLSWRNRQSLPRLVWRDRTHRGWDVGAFAGCFRDHAFFLSRKYLFIIIYI